MIAPARDACAATGRPGQALARALAPLGGVHREYDEHGRILPGWAGVWFDLDMIASVMLAAGLAVDVESATRIVQFTKVQSSTPPGDFSRVRPVTLDQCGDLIEC